MFLHDSGYRFMIINEDNPIFVVVDVILVDDKLLVVVDDLLVINDIFLL